LNEVLKEAGFDQEDIIYLVIFKPNWKQDINFDVLKDDWP
jgi:hypothetical protein